MSENSAYNIQTDIRFGFLNLIDVDKLVSEVENNWFNQSLCQINDSVVRVGVFKQGEFHWHKHDEEDELFFVLSGELIVETEEKSLRLKPHQGYAVPKGVVHRTLVEQPTVALMVEGANVQPTGDD